MPTEPSDLRSRVSLDLEVALDVVDELLMAAPDAEQRARTVDALVQAMCDMCALLDPEARQLALQRLRQAAAGLVGDA